MCVLGDQDFQDPQMTRPVANRQSLSFILSFEAKCITYFTYIFIQNINPKYYNDPYY